MSVVIVYGHYVCHLFDQFMEFTKIAEKIYDFGG